MVIVMVSYVVIYGGCYGHYAYYHERKDVKVIGYGYNSLRAS